MSNKTHYGQCDRGNESDPETWWANKTICGLEVYQYELDMTDRKEYTTCKHCLKQLNKQPLQTQQQ